MSEHEDDSNASTNNGMKLRPRRSVLTDISNKVLSIADATKKAVKKRKSVILQNHI